MQETNLYTATVPPILKALKALSAILDKANEHAASKASERRPVGKQMSALLNDRLVFDQFPLIMQVQIATDNAKGGVARLAEIEIPSYEDNETTVEELKARLAKTISFIESVKSEQIIGKEDVKVTLPYFQGKYFTGYDYAVGYLLPNFFFHVATAYSIIRKNGVDIGKTDFIGGIELQDL